METTQLYNEFIKICDEVLKFVTAQRLIYGALISLSFFLFWSVIAVMSSHMRKFYRKCAKLERYLNRHKVGYDNIHELDRYCGNISRGFLHGWNKFLKAKNKKPSESLTKREVLDAEVSDGVLNNGKTLMKTYIAITTTLLFIFNLAQIGKDLPFAFNILVESMFLPFVYYVVMILMYFVVNLIKQQEYIIATAHFYALVDKLDDCFVERELEIKEEINEPAIEDQINEQEEIVDEAVQETKEEQIVEEDKIEEVEEALVEPVEEPIDETKEELILDDESTEQNETPVVVGGVIDLEAFKINDEVPVTEDDEVIEEKIEEEQEKTIEEPVEELHEIEQAIPTERNWEAEEKLDTFDVFKKKNIDVNKYINEVPNEEIYTTPFIDVNSGVIPTDENLVFNMKEVEPEVIETTDESEEAKVEDFAEENIEETETKEISENQEQADEEIAEDEIEEAVEQEVDEVVEDELKQEETADFAGVFDLSQLLNEDDEDETDDVSDDEDSESQFEINDNESQVEVEEQDEIIENNEIINDLSDDINEFEQKIDSDFNLFEEEKEEDETNNLKAMLEQNLSDSSKEIDSKLESDIDLSSIVDEFKKNNQENIDEENDLSSLVGEFKQNFHGEAQSEESVEEEFSTNESVSQELVNKINDLENLINSALKNKDIDKEETKKTTKTKKTKKGGKKMENQTEKKSRGRPKMKAIDENLVITNEEEFEEILSRAEKLMRKSETGLSASQSKRIEKELKIMMDAMNKYKEGGK